MEWLMVLYGVFGWLACSVFGYCVFRREIRQKSSWVMSARIFGIVFFGLTGPIGAVTAGMTLVWEVLTKHVPWDKPVTW